MSNREQAIRTFAMALKQTALGVIHERDAAQTELNEVLNDGSRIRLEFSDPQHFGAQSLAARRRQVYSSLPFRLADRRLKNAIADCCVTLERIQHTVRSYPETESILDSVRAGVTVGSIPPEYGFGFAPTPAKEAE